MCPRRFRCFHWQQEQHLEPSAVCWCCWELAGRDQELVASELCRLGLDLELDRGRSHILVLGNEFTYNLKVLPGPDTWMLRAVDMIPLTTCSWAEGRALIPFWSTCLSEQLTQQIKSNLLLCNLGRRRRRKGESEFAVSSGYRYLQHGQLSSLLLRTEAASTVELSARCRGSGELSGLVSCNGRHGIRLETGGREELSELAEGVNWE